MKIKSTLLSLLTICCVGAMAQETPFKQPAADFMEIAFAKSSPRVSISPDSKKMLLSEAESWMTIESLSEDELRIGGLRINPANFSPSRQTYITSLAIEDVATGSRTSIEGLPVGVNIVQRLMWSPDSRRVAFVVAQPNGLYVWVAEVATGKARQLTDRKINASDGVSMSWRGNDEILVNLVPANAANPPAADRVPRGVVAQENIGKSRPARTYPDMLKSKYDEQLFDYYMTSELARVKLDGTVIKIGKAKIYNNFSQSPDNQYILVTTTEQPYLYTQPYQAFPKRVTLIAAEDGKKIKEVGFTPTYNNPIGYDMTSPYPRGFSWRLDKPATMVWTEALDGGNPRENPMEYMDAVYVLDAPFTAEKREFLKTKKRFGGIVWGNDNLALVTEMSRQSRRVTTYRFSPTNPMGTMKMIFDRSSDDNYNDLGSPLTVRNQYERSVLWTDKKSNELLLTSSGASPEGDMPYISRFDMTTLKNTILWRCKAPYYEQIVDVVDPAIPDLIISRQSLDTPVNYYLVNVKKKSERQLTDFQPKYRTGDLVTKQKIHYKRADGVDLTATLYLPAGYDPARDGRLPVYMWAYPREFNSADDAAQVRGSKYTYTPLSYRGQAIWATRGYAVMDEVEMPIVGGKDVEPNDNFIEQLVMNARAAINTIVEMGIGDANRMAIGGHSYGAFMTANLLTNTNLFKAGIARSGAYNRTLTPFGFQNETRTYWEAPDVYNKMSPFMHANTSNGALLLVHGELDNNQGTFPIQSERMFAALQGNGGTVRYVVLPFESHGYSSFENNAHLLWETEQWLDRWVKNAK